MSYADEALALAAQALSARRVLELADDPTASTADLARLVETDPVLSMQVMRLANSPGYGVSGTVSSASRAVVLLGFATVRALAASAVCNLLGGGEQRPRAGFWSHSAGTAVCASVVARHVGVPPQDAFTVGLLHDIGAAAFHKRHGGYDELCQKAGTDQARLLELEREAFGTTHPEVAAHLLTDWRLPPAFVRAVGQHHLPPDEVRGTLSLALIAGASLAARLDAERVVEPVADLDRALQRLGLNVGFTELSAEARAEAVSVAKTLGVAA